MPITEENINHRDHSTVIEWHEAMRLDKSFAAQKKNENTEARNLCLKFKIQFTAVATRPEAGCGKGSDPVWGGPRHSLISSMCPVLENMFTSKETLSMEIFDIIF